MSSRKISSRVLLFSGVLFCFPSFFAAQAQDVDVPGNLTMHDSTDSTVGNLLKEGVPFLHNFGVSNTFLGSGAGNFTMSGSENTGNGVGTLTSNTTGSDNTATGFGALGSNDTGIRNTATGRTALFSNTSGNENTATGAFALLSNTTGSGNTAIGWQALQGNTTGGDNIAIGLQALGDNTNGSHNIAIGANALWLNTGGHYNTATGISALVRNTGTNNTAFGGGALSLNTDGSYNTAIGYLADVPLDSHLNNATAIGSFTTVNASNKIRFGNNAVTVIEGQVPYTYTSDRNEKENLRAVDAEAVLTKLRGLAVTSWNYKGQDAQQFRHYGPMAQDFFAAFGHDAVGTIGTPTTITSGDLDGILMIAAQALEKRTVEQEKEIAQLRARLEALERRLGVDGRAEL